jgi:hypothetical protein
LGGLYSDRKGEVADLFVVAAQHSVGELSVIVEVKLFLIADNNLTGSPGRNRKHSGFEAVTFFSLLKEARVNSYCLKSLEDLSALILGNRYCLSKVPINVKGIARYGDSLRQRKSKLTFTLS